MQKLIEAHVLWEESVTGEFTWEELGILESQDAHQIVEVFWERGAPFHAALISEILARNTQKAAQVARVFCLDHAGSAPDQYIRLAFDQLLLSVLLKIPIGSLPETGLPHYLTIENPDKQPAD